jgi:putative ABC transport system ATP-binding protein
VTTGTAGEWVVRSTGLAKSRRDSERHFDVIVPDIALRPGSRMALLGESGSGKSTILSLLALATYPDQAERFEIGGVDVACAWAQNDTASLSFLRARSIAYLPQRDGLLEFLTVRENIYCCAEIAGALPVQDIDAIMQILHLSDLLEARPANLSGGQRQRAAVACALARRPALILADEPTAALDAANADRVMTALCNLSGRIGAAIVLATHQTHLIAAYDFTPMVASLTGAHHAWRSTFQVAA